MAAHFGDKTRLSVAPFSRGARPPDSERLYTESPLSSDGHNEPRQGNLSDSLSCWFVDSCNKIVWSEGRPRTPWSNGLGLRGANESINRRRGGTSGKPLSW